MKKNLSIVLSLALVALMSACHGGSGKNSTKGGVSLTAAGATFPQPYYNLAFQEYNKESGNQVNYGGIGSGGGIRSLKDMVVDFGASDAYLSDEELKEMPSAILHIPTCMGAVVLSYNLPGITQLKMSGDLIAKIYLGKITMWNDPAIVAENEGIKLPAQKITPVYRSDGSGTTFVFSDYMTKVSPEWASVLGTGKSLKWTTGIASKGNPGVAGTITQTVGTIGYIGSEYAFAMKLPTALLKNSAGNYVAPSGASISAAASTDLPADNRAMVTNTPAANGYPISCFTWILIYKEQNYQNHSIEKARATVGLLQWMLSPEAQAKTTQIHYAPLPASAIANSKKLLETVTFNGVKL